jgi:hypothetical protein
VRYDLISGKVLKTKERPDKETYFASPTLSPDGKLLFVTTGRMVKFKTDKEALAVLDADTLAELARIPADAKPGSNVYFETPHFSPNGKTMITRCGGGPLIVWDVTARQVTRRVPVADIDFGRSLLSPDGKRAVVAGHPKIDPRSFSRDPDPADAPQPRVVLIDLADEKSKPEVLMLQNGACGGAAFSPDGKTLVVGGSGGAYLLDVTRRAKE